ncbi:beta strand repeat-containing protein, partial [Methanobrevibacter filiformis]|uniref:beta strand repeat-containing protein n=1 Tax=Methanobrevibacter filiformis TaxID=55758 RepID=UPI0034E06AB2
MILRFNFKKSENMKKIIISLVFLIVLSLSISSIHAASDVYIAPDGDDQAEGSLSNPYASLEKAVINVEDNGTIYLGNGIYNGTKNRNITVNKTTTFIGESKGNVIINAEGQSRHFNISSGITVTFINITFTNGRAIGVTNGGSIYNSLDSTLNIRDSSFTSNSASNNGSTIYNNGDLDIKDSSFSSNSGGNGTIFNVGNLNINNTTFNNNTNTATRSYGGAIYNNINSNVSILDSIFMVNTAAVSGGAIYNRGNISVNRSNFTSNTIYNTIDSTININDSSFITNGISNEGNLTIFSSNFTNISSGSSIDNIGTNSNATVSNSDFIKNNIAISNAGKFILDGSSFINNTNGISNSGTFSLNTSNFINNTGSTSGAIYNTARLNVSNSNFTNNNGSSTGGAIYSGSAVNIDYSNFISNSRAIHLGLGDTRSNISNSNFTNNTVAMYIYANYTSVTQNNIINNNQGIVIYGTASRIAGVKINYNRIFNNTNVSGYDLENLGNVNATLNWWGSNNPKINGGSPANYFIVTISEINQNTLNYSLVLNNSNVEYDLSLMPDFNGSISSSLGVDIFDAKDNNILTYSPEYVHIEVDNYDFVLSTDVYVNATGGNDNNDGASWDTALASINKALW